METKELDSLEDLLTAIYIQQSRVYDVMLAILALSSEETAETLMKLHAEGDLMSPPPALKGTPDES